MTNFQFLPLVRKVLDINPIQWEKAVRTYIRDCNVDDNTFWFDVRRTTVGKWCFVVPNKGKGFDADSMYEVHLGTANILSLLGCLDIAAWPHDELTTVREIVRHCDWSTVQKDSIIEYFRTPCWKKTAFFDALPLISFPAHCDFFVFEGLDANYDISWAQTAKHDAECEYGIICRRGFCPRLQEDNHLHAKRREKPWSCRDLKLSKTNKETQTLISDIYFIDDNDACRRAPSTSSYSFIDQRGLPRCRPHKKTCLGPSGVNPDEWHKWTWDNEHNEWIIKK